ncbi:MAG: GntR family transcriptional regulator [Streptosporangiaceae bacterium]
MGRSTWTFTLSECPRSIPPASCRPTGRSPRSSRARSPPASTHAARIPTESELVASYEIARSTARRAVAWLRDQNLVETVPTRGSYVL